MDSDTGTFYNVDRGDVHKCDRGTVHNVDTGNVNNVNNVHFPRSYDILNILLWESFLVS